MVMNTKKPSCSKAGGFRRKNNKRHRSVAYAICATLILISFGVLHWYTARPNLETAAKLMQTGNVEKSLSMYSVLAERGNLEAVKRLAHHYYHDVDIPVNHAKAVPYLEQLSKSGDMEATTMLANVYYQGSHGQKEHTKALSLLTPMQQTDNSMALALLGHLYFDGEGVEQNLERAFTFFLRAHELGDSTVKARLGVMYYRGKGTSVDYTKARELLAPIPVGNNPEVDRTLGKMYFLGQGTDVALSRAAQRLARTDVGADPEASYCLGMLYHQGIGVKQSDQQAVIHLEQAISGGYTQAITPLGEMYYRGVANGEPDFKKAASLFEKAYRNGDAAAALFLGKMAFDGSGMDVDYAKAVTYLEQAVKRGNSKDAHFLIGCIYYYGKLGEPDYQAAAPFLIYAAGWGDIQAQVLLANMFYYGRGVDQDYTKALQYLAMGIAHKNADALALRGRMYYYGDGGDWDVEKAKAMLQQAAELGSDDALKLLNADKILMAERKMRTQSSNASTSNDSSRSSKLTTQAELIDAKKYECIECSVADFRVSAGRVFIASRGREATSRFDIAYAKEASQFVKRPGYLPGYVQAVDGLCSRNGIPEVPPKYRRRIQALIPKMTRLANIALISDEKMAALGILGVIRVKVSEAGKGRKAETPEEAFRIAGIGLESAEYLVAELEKQMAKVDGSFNSNTSRSNFNVKTQESRNEPKEIDTKSGNRTATLNSAASRSDFENTIRHHEKEAKTTVSGLQYVILQEGKGAKPSRGQTIEAEYTGHLMDGRIFDTTVGRSSFIIAAGKGQVIQGMDEALLDMKVGEKRMLIIPPKLAFGSRRGPGSIPPNATLYFEVERLK